MAQDMLDASDAISAQEDAQAAAAQAAADAASNSVTVDSEQSVTLADGTIEDSTDYSDGSTIVSDMSPDGTTTLTQYDVNDNVISSDVLTLSTTITVTAPASTANACTAALQTAGQTLQSVQTANSDWSIIAQAASANNIDPALLAAVAVRESGVRDISENDGAGVGVGVFQLTVSPTSGVTADEANNLAWSANYAASLLSSDIAAANAYWGNSGAYTASQMEQVGIDAYNMGFNSKSTPTVYMSNFTGNPATIDGGTANNNYGSNVMQLMACFPPKP